MNVLVIGGGGREHAIVWKLAQSPKVKNLYCAPGNAGMTGLAQQVPISVLDFPAIIEFCRQTAIDRVIVAPDDPLALGLVNELEEAGIRAFGPTRAAARIEASKVFAKTIMNTIFRLRTSVSFMRFQMLWPHWQTANIRLLSKLTDWPRERAC
jgi:phosphoribosylamine--glycine ligase